MKKTTLLFFAAGAVAGWAVAQRTLGDTQSWEKSYGQLSDEWDPPVTVDTTSDDSEPTRITTRDPFRAAFQGAQAEIEAHNRLMDGADDAGDTEAEEHVA